ncbi:MAG: SIMPL domain-containing protein [bacterium]
MNFWPNWYEHKFFTLTFGLLMTLLVILVGSQAYNSLRVGALLGDPDPTERTISVDGESSMAVSPDIATITLGVESEAETVSEAQTKNTETTNAILSAVKALGISDNDVQTSYYNVYENEEWDPATGDWESMGWIVSQSIEVTVRDTSMVGSILTVGGDNGATSIYGPDFRVDDTGDYLQEARAEAIADARKNAEAIADALGLHLGEVVDYYEWISSGDDYRYFSYGEGMGGAIEPAIEQGTEEISMEVTVTYTLR